MKRVTLATGPGSTCPDDTVARHFLGNLVGRLLVKQRIEIVEQFGTHVLVFCIHVDVLTEIRLDTFHAHFEQPLQQTFIPLGGFVVSEVDSARIVECGEVGTLGFLLFRQRADVVVLAGLRYLFSSFGHVWQLPERHAESFVLQTFDKSRGIGEAFLVELPFAEPVGLEPSRVEMDDVAGIMLAAQTVADGIHLIG